MRITIYNKDRKFTGQVGAPESLTITPRVFPLVGTAVMVVPLSSPAVPKLRQDGARLVVEDDGEHLISGPIDEVQIDSETGMATVIVIDDADILRGILGWQVPNASIAAQLSAEYRTYTGKAEDVVKQVVRENGVERLKIPGLVVAPSRGRGSVIGGGASFRMHPLHDRLYPGVEMAGIGLQVRQIGTELVFDVYTPRVYSTVLSTKSRTLKKAVHNRRRPTASRVVIGGPGEGTERRYRTLVDTAREAAWGFTGETFRDARDAQYKEGETTWAEIDATMDARGEETLKEAGVVDGLSVTLAESSVFIYGAGGIRIGDYVPVDVGGTIITDTIKEAVIEWITPTYSRATPTIGEQTDPVSRQAKTLAALKESQRREERA